MRLVGKLFGLNHALLMRAGLSSIAIKLGSVGLSFLLAVVLARSLGPTDFGRYSYVISIIFVLAIPTQLGLPKLVVRETAKADFHANWDLVRGLWRWSNIAILVLSAVVMVGVAALTVFGDLKGQQLVLLGVLLIPLVSLGNIRGAALRGLGRVVMGQIPETILKPLFLILLILGFRFFLPLQLFTAEYAMLLHIFAAGSAFVIGAVLLARAKPVALINEPQPVYHTRQWILAAVPLGLITGLQVINNNLDIVMLGIYRAPAEVGIYRVVVTTATFVAFGLQAINLVIMPGVARLHAKGDFHALQVLVTSSARIILMLAAPATVILIIFGGWILGTAFGAGFAKGQTILIVLTVGQLANAVFGSVGLLLNMGGFEKETLIGVALATCANVVLNLTLIPLYGGLGAAVATATTLIVWNAILCWRVYVRIGVNSTAIRFRSKENLI